jgi:predicted AAA+ superfamily ATPase
MLAHNQAGLLNAAQLARGIGVTGNTVAHYLELLVDLLLLRRLQPWRGNVGKGLVKSPKIYIRDSGLVHALLGLANKEELRMPGGMKRSGAMCAGAAKLTKWYNASSEFKKVTSR